MFRRRRMSLPIHLDQYFDFNRRPNLTAASEPATSTGTSYSWIRISPCPYNPSVTFLNVYLSRLLRPCGLRWIV